MWIRIKQTFAVLVLQYLTIISVRASETNFPSNVVERCRLKDDKLNSCIIDRIKQLKPKLREGIPELKISKLKEIGAVRVAYNLQNLTVTLNNPLIYGMDDFDIEQLALNVQESTLILNVVFKNVTLKTAYNLTGDVKSFDLDGINSVGYLEANNTDLSVRLNLSGFHEIRGGKEYITFNETKTEVVLGSVTVLLEFRENSRIVERLATQRDAFKQIAKPYLKDAIGSILKLIALRVFELYSIDELFIVS